MNYQNSMTRNSDIQDIPSAFRKLLSVMLEKAPRVRLGESCSIPLNAVFPIVGDDEAMLAGVFEELAKIRLTMTAGQQFARFSIFNHIAYSLDDNILSFEMSRMFIKWLDVQEHNGNL